MHGEMPLPEHIPSFSPLIIAKNVLASDFCKELLHVEKYPPRDSGPWAVVERDDGGFKPRGFGFQGEEMMTVANRTRGSCRRVALLEVFCVERFCNESVAVMVVISRMQQYSERLHISKIIKYFHFHC
jgi:hypothetical protein